MSDGRAFIQRGPENDEDGEDLLDEANEAYGGAIRLGAGKRKLRRRGRKPGPKKGSRKGRKGRKRMSGKKLVARQKLVRARALKQVLAHLKHVRKGAHRIRRGRGRRLGGALRGYEYNFNP